ncbi:MAG: carboxylesterase family protein [Candidatus Electrothrix sp. LOE1_4_5]|nr:carboxylesterase family protein [Candidatus Electrothrix gigas]
MIYHKKIQHLMIVVSVVTFCLFLNHQAHALSAVQTQTGSVVGVQAKNGVQMFLGIPYAKPPVGSLRWKSPQPADPWTVFMANKYGPSCPQKRVDKVVEGTSEDCLTLNIWTPDSTQDKQLPVMVWFHPGSFSINSGSTWSGENLAKEGNVVVVSMNYRLNVFGFLALEELKAEDPNHPTTGNYGFEDQLLSLKWVQENIANFGGDPSNITIFGESSGGMAVSALLVSPKAKGLFHKAITQSGPSKAVDKPMDQAIKESNEQLSKLGCQKGDGFLACLRSKSADEIESSIPPEVGLSGLTWTPVNDKIFLDDSPADLFEQGKMAQGIPVLYLVTKDEQMLMVNGQDMMDINEKAYKDTVADLIDSKADTKKVLEQYAASKYSSPAYALGAILTDRDVKCLIRKELRSLSKAGANVYMSYFTAGRDIPSVKPLGAFHTVDVDFVFLTKEGGFGLNEKEQVLSRSIISYWSSFAYTGNPNAMASGVAWPKYDMEGNEQYIEFDTDNISVEKDLFPQCDFWDAL